MMQPSPRNMSRCGSISTRKALPADAADVLPAIRGALARAAGDAWPKRWILDLRPGETARRISDDQRLADWAGRGVMRGLRAM